MRAHLHCDSWWVRVWGVGCGGGVLCHAVPSAGARSCPSSVSWRDPWTGCRTWEPTTGTRSWSGSQITLALYTQSPCRCAVRVSALLRPLACEPALAGLVRLAVPRDRCLARARTLTATGVRVWTRLLACACLLGYHPAPGSPSQDLFASRPFSDSSPTSHPRVASWTGGRRGAGRLER
jgi:hypothetical protein